MSNHRAYHLITFDISQLVQFASHAKSYSMHPRLDGEIYLGLEVLVKNPSKLIKRQLQYGDDSRNAYFWQLNISLSDEITL